MKIEKYIPVKEVREEAERILANPLQSKDDLNEALISLFRVQEKICQLSKTIDQLTILSSKLNKVAADYAASHPEVMEAPVTEVKPGIRQGWFTGHERYILTESVGTDSNGAEKTYPLWGRIPRQGGSYERF